MIGIPMEKGNAIYETTVSLQFYISLYIEKTLLNNMSYSTNYE